MQLGIHINTFRRPTLVEAFDAVAAEGLSCVHFNMSAADLPSMPEHIEDDACDRIVEAAAANRVSIASLSGTFNMIHPSVDVRAAGLRRLDAIAEAAWRIRAPVVPLCTGTRDPDNMWKPHPDNDAPEAWNDLVESLGQALDIAQRHGITLAVEPEMSNVVNSAVKARRLLDEMQSTRLKIILDAANLLDVDNLDRAEVVLDEAFDLLGQDIVLGHAKDIDRNGQAGQVPAGKGVLPFEHYLGLFAKARFDGPLILHSLDEDEVPDAVQFLREVMA